MLQHDLGGIFRNAPTPEMQQDLVHQIIDFSLPISVPHGLEDYGDQAASDFIPAESDENVGLIVLADAEEHFAAGRSFMSREEIRRQWNVWFGPVREAYQRKGLWFPHNNDPSLMLAWNGQWGDHGEVAQKRGEFFQISTPLSAPPEPYDNQTGSIGGQSDRANIPSQAAGMDGIADQVMVESSQEGERGMASDEGDAASDGEDARMVTDN